MQLSEAYSVPDHVVTAITSYDPDLRLRWARQVGKVRLERKVTRSGQLNPAWFKKFDDYEGCRDGYIMVFEFDPLPESWGKLIHTLALTDMWAKGSPAKVAGELEETEREREAALKRERMSLFNDYFRDLYAHINTVKTCPEGAGHHAYLGTGRGEAL